MFGADRILYGTDHPYAHPSCEMFNEMVDALDHSESERELISHGNAERLLSIQAG